METITLPACDPTALEQACALLRAGRLVAFPTDTVYGVGVLLSLGSGQARAVARLYAVKGRPEGKGIPILLASLADLALVVEDVNETAARLAAAFWPGPLTLVLPKGPAVPSEISRTSTVAVRVPAHPLARALIAAAGAPLAVTSANRSGEPPTTDPVVVRRTLGGRIAAILDGGKAFGGVPSTIVDCSAPGAAPFSVLRSGPISAAALATATGRDVLRACETRRPTRGQ